MGVLVEALGLGEEGNVKITKTEAGFLRRFWEGRLKDLLESIPRVPAGPYLDSNLKRADKINRRIQRLRRFEAWGGK